MFEFIRLLKEKIFSYNENEDPLETKGYNNIYFNQDIIFEISRYLDSESLKRLISTCSLTKSSDSVFFNRYYIDFNKINIYDLNYCLKPNTRDYNYLVKFLKKIKNVKYIDNLNLLRNFLINVKRIKFSDKFRKPLTYTDRHGLERSLIPDSVTHLFFGIYFNQPLEFLHNSVTHISLGHCFNQDIDFLPDSIVYLRLGCNFCRSLNNLPESLQYLDVSEITFFCRFNDKEHMITDLIDNPPPNLKLIKVNPFEKKDFKGVFNSSDTAKKIDICITNKYIS